MKRLSFLASLFGFGVAAKAQQWSTPILDENHLLTDKKRPALNNQCPVCGTMAEPYKRLTERETFLEFIKANPRLDLPSSDAPFGALSVVVRCSRCNAAFYLDAEK